MPQSDEDQARATAIKRLMTLAQQDRVKIELQWQLCMDYLNGEIFLLRNKWTGELTRFRVGENRTAFSKNNAVRPINRALMAKLCRMIPSFAVQRATSDSDELFAARACEALLEFIYHNKRMDVAYVGAMDYMTALGDAFIVPEWSMDVGKPIAFCPECDQRYPANMVGQQCPYCQGNIMAQAQLDALQEHQAQMAARGQQPGQPGQPGQTPQQLGQPPAQQSPSGQTVGGPGGLSPMGAGENPGFGSFMGISNANPPETSGLAAPHAVQQSGSSALAPGSPQQPGGSQPVGSGAPTGGSSLIEPVHGIRGGPEAGVPGSGVEGSITSDTTSSPVATVPLLEAGHSGGVILSVYAPWEVYTEPNVKKVEEMGWVILSKRVPVHEARRRYPWAGKYIHADTLASDINAFKFLNSPLPDASGYVTIYKYIERGTALTPTGRIIHMVNNYIVQQDLNCVYDALGYMQVCHFSFEPNLKERSCWSRSWILDGHHHQRELNSLEEIIKEYGERHVRFKLLTPHGANVKEDDVTSPNILVKFSPGAGQITPLQLNQLPQAVFERRQLLVSDMRAEAGVSDADAMNTSDPNARAMSIVQAESMQQMKHILVRIYSEWVKLGYIVLAMYQRYGDPNETYTTIGGENPEIFSFRDVRLTPGFDIVVEVEDGLSSTQPVRLQEAVQLATIGNGVLFQDPTTGQFDVGAFAQYARLKLPNIRPDQETTEYSAAMQMIHDLMDGKQVGPQPEDDPAIFQMVLIHWLRGKGRRMTMTGDPQAAQVVNEVRQAYQYYVTLEAQAKLRQMAQQAQQGGGGPEPGGQPGQQQPKSPGGQATAKGQPNNQIAQKGAQTGSPVLQQAGATISAADKHGEAAARQTLQHEG